MADIGETGGMAHRIDKFGGAYGRCGVDMPFASRYRVTHEKPKCGLCKEAS